MPQRPGSWIAVHDTSSEMRMLYISSNAKNIIDHEPSECIGRPISDFLTSECAISYTDKFASRTSDNITVGYITMYGPIPNTDPFVIRIISFICDSIHFTVASYHPIYEHMLERERVRRFRFAAEDEARQTTMRQIQQAIHNEGMEVDSQVLGAANSVPGHSAQRSPVPVQSCVILDNLQPPSGLALSGPGILFVTNTIEQIINKDASDLQGTSFLTHVAPADVLNAGEFLQKIASSPDVAFVTLDMLLGNIPTTGHMSDPIQQQKYIKVEIMGSGSEDGAILLLQPAQTLRLRRVCRGGTSMDGDCDVGSGYMSLEELISSEAETSGYDSAWQSHRYD